MSIKGQAVTVFGFGPQGRAQALNARDSGWDITVCVRPNSPHLAEIKSEKLNIITDPVVATKEATIAVLLIADAAQPEFYHEFLKPHLQPQASLIFAHGYNIHYKQITPRDDIDILMVAPSLHGDALRSDYLSGDIVPILTSVEQDPSEQGYRLVEDFAKAIGGKKTKILATTFKEETETDLFAEQSVLCGGLTSLIKAGFQTLIDAGYNKEIAYFCCVRELKAVTNVIYREGLYGFRKKISSTACYGDLTRGPRVINEEVQQEMRKILDEITSGTFAKELATEKEAGFPNLKKLMEAEAAHETEKVRIGLE